MLREKLSKEYNEIWDKCAITTASCSNFAPFLLGLLHSLKMNYFNHPQVYVADLGMTAN